MSDVKDFELLSEVFDKVPSAIVVLDERGFIKRANASAHFLLAVEVLEGRSWLEVIKEVFRPRKDDGHEISTKDGRRLQVATLPLSKGKGQLVQMTDLTETRVLQDKLNHMERLSSLGKMAASLAHQIRTPLSAAMLYAANLGNNNLPINSRINFQKKLISRLEDLNNQVSDILMFARSGTQTVNLIDAKDIIAQASSNVVSNVTKANVTLDVVNTSESMPIMGNLTALCGALTNLIVNAIEAKAKNIKLQLDAIGNEIVFSVANDGPAIDEHMRNKIFEPFFTSKSNGTGLGLAVVNAVAKVHQGRVELTSDANFNTIFKIYVPIFVKERLNNKTS